MPTEAAVKGGTNLEGLTQEAFGKPCANQLSLSASVPQVRACTRGCRPACGHQLGSRYNPLHDSLSELPSLCVYHQVSRSQPTFWNLSLIQMYKAM